MSIVEKVHRKVVSLGLIPKLVAKLPQLSLLSFIGGLGWLLLVLPSDGQYRRTYISENALMPSQAYSYFRESEWNILRGYRTQLEGFGHVASLHESNAEVASWFQEFGIKTALYKDKDYGETLYGIMHASRGDGTEAMVIAAPWYTEEDKYNVGGVALTISMARFFSRWPLWSKNIIFVLSENPGASLRSWVKAYHTSLDLTGGTIESAIVLDYPGANDYFDYVQVFYSGLNGELPNLDLINVAVHISEHEGMKVSLHGLPLSEIDGGSFMSRLKVMLHSIKDSALAGIKTCQGHEAFSGWRIQSLTLKASGNNGPYDITTFGRIPEAISRSVNNLLEKFHQSFFFYLLLSPGYFISIGTYLPSAVAISVSFALAVLNQILNNKYSDVPVLSTYNIWSVLSFSVALLISFSTSQFFFQFPHPELLLLFNAVLAAAPLIFKRRVKIQEPFSYRFKALAYMYFSVVLTSLLVLNFPLSFCMGVLAWPMTRVTTNVNNTLRKTLRNVLLLAISNPFIGSFLAINLFEPKLPGMAFFQGLLRSWSELGCWTWYIICLGWYPSWLLVAYSSIDAVKISSKKEV